jgi:hypothetical protein
MQGTPSPESEMICYAWIRECTVMTITKTKLKETRLPVLEVCPKIKAQ